MSDEQLASLLERMAACEAKQERHERIIKRIVNTLTARRDSLIMDLGTLEEALGVERTIQPRSKRFDKSNQ